MAALSSRRLATVVWLLILASVVGFFQCSRSDSAKASAQQRAETGREVRADKTSPAAVAPASATELAAELTRLLALASPEERLARLDEFWRRWFARDRSAVLAVLAAMPSGDERTQALLYVIMALAETDPDAALGQAIALVRDAQEAPVFSSLFDLFARQDLAAARDKLARVPVGPGFDFAWRAYADAHARADLSGALEWAKGLAEGPSRALALETVLYSLAERDAVAAFEMALQSLSGEAQDRSLYQALMQIIPFDPAGAARLIVAMPASPARELAAAAAARAWAEDHPADALAWIASLPGAGETTALATANVLEIWAQKDGALAKEALAALPEGEARAAAAERVAGVLTQTAPEAAFAWAMALADGLTHERAVAAVVATWARQDPASAAAWMTASGTAAERGALLADVVSHWALQDLTAAQRYVGTLGDAALLSPAVAALAPYLAQADPQAARAWAENFSAPRVREEALSAVNAAVQAQAAAGSAKPVNDVPPPKS